MSKMEIQKVINNNTINPLSPTSVDLTGCGKIVPGKFTFLKSNQLITTYVQQGNVRQNLMTEISKKKLKNNAYDTCETEKVIHEELKREKLLKIEKTLNQAKKNSQLHQLEIQQNQAEIQNQVKKIELMIEGTYIKAADIMFGRNNSTFTRKPTQDVVPLKDMKQYTCDKSLKKVQATRKVMISKSQAILQTVPYDKELSLEVSALSDSFNTSNSLISNSGIVNSKINKKITQQRENKLKKLLKTQSFEDLFNAKRRNAANEGFGMCWQVGNTTKKTGKFNLFKNTEEKQPKLIKKARKTQFATSYLQQICNTESCQLAINKKYNNAFNKLTGQFSLQYIQKQ